MIRRLTLVVVSLSFLGSTRLQADELPERVVVATWNLEWFFDHYRGDNGSDLSREQSAPGREEWDWKLNGVAEAVAQMRPTILALQEVENRRVLYYLTRRLKEEHGLSYRIAYIEGWDNYTEQDVAVLYQSGLVEYSRREQSDEEFRSQEFYSLNKHLFARFEWTAGEGRESLTLLTMHLRATPEAADIRQRQMRLARRWIEDAVLRGENVIVLGDLNTEETSQPPDPASDLGILLGLGTSEEADDLIDLHSHLPADARVTHLTGKQYDRILVSRSLAADSPNQPGLVFQSITRPRELAIRGAGPDADHFNVFYQIPQEERDLSDHYPVVAEFLRK